MMNPNARNFKNSTKEQYDILLSRNIIEPWTSMREILPAIEFAWGMTVEKNKVPLKSLRLEAKNAAKNLNYLLGARRIIIPKLNETFCWWIILLRSGFNYKGQFIIHEHGETTKGRYSTINPYLRNDDILIVASQASLKTARLMYPKIVTSLVPFPILARSSDILELDEVKKINKNKKICFAYIGRVSEQKNLHTLLLAMWIVKNHYKIEMPKLHVFGEEDRLGSPNMDFKFKDYLKYLKTLTQRLGLSKHVKWHGQYSRARLHKWIQNHSHIFISPSLHSDENYGVAAFTSLAFGNKAVLSDWGGHSDLARYFGNTTLVSVQLSDRGPVISPIKLAKCLVSSINKKNTNRIGVPKYFAVKRVVRLLKELENQPRRMNKKNNLIESKLLKDIEKRKKRLRALRKSRSASLVFSGYDDPYALPLFTAYGAKRQKIRKFNLKKQYLSVPWANISKSQIVVNDPHRGICKKKCTNNFEILNWLINNGYAFSIDELSSSN